jgi:hypothetical protein
MHQWALMKAQVPVVTDFALLLPTSRLTNVSPVQSSSQPLHAYFHTKANSDERWNKSRAVSVYDCSSVTFYEWGRLAVGSPSPH